MIKPTFKLEKELLEQGYEMVIGVDEAGRGPLAGPVVACAASLKSFCHSRESGNPGFNSTTEFLNKTFDIHNAFSKNPGSLPAGRQAGFLQGRTSKPGMTERWNLIRDSKMLNHKQRESLYDFIHEHFYVGVGICDHKTIDRMNILQASFLAVKKAITNLNLKIKKEKCWIPGQVRNDKFIILMDGKLSIPNFSPEQRAIIGGDKIVKSISAASIIAKVTRDRIMLEMHQKYPEYCFDKHKGYGTKLHMEMLQMHGHCEIHRRSFAPVRLARGE